ncbi:MAG: TauD/TfdA dioxygenase family protein [Burkholderiales bacterium]
MALRITPLHPHIGASAEGIDLRVPLPPAIAKELEAAMDQYAVMVFPDQDLSDRQQMDFGLNFGPVESTRATVDQHRHRLSIPEMNDISNLDVDGSILKADDRRRLFELGNRLWHSDSSFKATPAKYSMLHARSVPPEGGETEFADMRAAWDALPEKMRARVKDLVSWHSLLYSRARLGFHGFTEHEKQQFEPVPQRLVRRHEGSGRLSLYLSSHIGRIEGWIVPEAMAFVGDLIEHATQREFVYQHHWQLHDLVVWDNRCTMHRGRAYDDVKYERDMRRVTLQDSAPTLEQAV